MAAKRKSAYFAATEAAQKQQSSETVIPSSGETDTLQYRETAKQLYSNTVTRQGSKASEEFEKITFYLTAEQAEKLDDLAHDYKKQTGQRINRNDIVRYLIDLATLDSLEGIKHHVRKAAAVISTQEHPESTSTPAQFAALETEVHQLQQRLDIEEMYRTDTRSHHFKRWIRNHDHPQDTDFFFKRFLADGQLPEHASRGLYEAKMRTAGYSEEDLHLFQDTWKAMLFPSEWK